MKYILILVMVLTTILGAGCTFENSNGDVDMDDSKKIGWSASGKLEQLNTLREVSLQANFLANPRNYTAQFKLSGDLKRKKVQAEITWSVEGNSIRRVVTVSDGTSVQGTGQGVNIKVRDISTLAIAAGTDPEYIASIQVVPGTRGSTSNPPTLDTMLATLIAANSFLDVPVPTDAGVISVAVTVASPIAAVIPDQQVQVQQIDSTSGIQNNYDPRQYFWVPLTPSVTIIRIYNFSLLNAIYAKAVFGIDG